MSALISEEYRALNAEKHDTSSAYGGVNSPLHAEHVLSIATEYGCRDLLDYGAGKGALGETLFSNGFTGDYHPYDPAIPYWSGTPQPADMVASIDVLEHIEPECIEAVLDDLKRCLRKVGFFTIGQAPAKKSLPDGRNAHILIRPDEWWIERLGRRFRVVKTSPLLHKRNQANKIGLAVLVEPK